MKKLLALLLALVACLSLCACGDTEAATATDISVDAVTLDATAEGFLARVSGFTQSMEAGSDEACTLVADLLDWYEQNHLTKARMTELTAFLYDAFSDEDKAAFTENLDALYEAALSVCGRDTKDKVTALGVDTVRFPWSRSSAKAIFTAVYAGVGLDAPTL